MTHKATRTPAPALAPLARPRSPVQTGGWLRWAALVPPALAVLVSLVWGTTLPHDAVIALIHEDGPVESLTVLLYLLLALALWCVPRPGDDTRPRAAITLLVLALAARELDLHKHFTGGSVLKVSFYLHDAPLLHKLVALPILLVILATAAWLALRYVRPLWRDLRRGRPLAVTMAVFFATLVLTKLIDRSFAILAEDFGIVMSAGLDAVLSGMEEVGECSLPLILAVGLGQYQHERASGSAAG